MKMFPHERSLVTRMQNRPFTLLGVNNDRDPQKLKRDLVTHQVNWRSFKNQRPGSGADTSISRAWQVRGYPALFLIDHKGVIRQKWLGNPGEQVLDDAIEKLVREAEGEKGKAKKG